MVHRLLKFTRIAIKHAKIVMAGEIVWCLKHHYSKKVDRALAFPLFDKVQYNSHGCGAIYGLRPLDMHLALILINSYLHFTFEATKLMLHKSLNRLYELL